MAMLVVAGLLLVMGLFHSIVGERFILQPLKRTEALPKIMNSEELLFVTVQATWHLVSVLWLGIAAHLVSLYLFPEMAPRSFLTIFAVLFTGLAIVPFFVGATKYKTWIVFGVIGALLTWSAVSWVPDAA